MYRICAFSANKTQCRAVSEMFLHVYNLSDQSFHFSSGLPKPIGSCFPNLIIRADSTSCYIRIKIIVMKFSNTASTSACVLVIW